MATTLSLLCFDAQPEQMPNIFDTQTRPNHFALPKPTYPAILEPGGPPMNDIKGARTMDPGDEVLTAPVAAAEKGVHRNSVHKAIKEVLRKLQRRPRENVGATCFTPRSGSRHCV